MARQDRIGTHKTTIGNDGFFNYVQYHSTKVVQWNNEKIILNSGGWHTNTTKTRINQTARQFNLGFYVFQKDFNWYVSSKNHIMLFTNNMEIARI